MNQTETVADQIHRAFIPTSQGVIGVVDALLELCREQSLRFDWIEDVCRVYLPGVPPENVDVTLQKSVFRAILARIAALCNQHASNSASPYGGEGELILEGDSPVRIHVKFKNSSEEQRLELAKV